MQILERTENNTAKSVELASCPSCASSMQSFYRISDVPTNSCILMQSAEQARQHPRGEIVLGFCDSCGFICNQTFEPELTKYSQQYEETQSYSSTFNRYHHELASDLVGRLQLHRKSVIEIGCGKGEFLGLLCSLGENSGLGFDPGYDRSRGVLEDMPDVEVISDFYSDKYQQHQAELVACKMTLEHIPQTAHFIGLARGAMRGDGSSTLYIQVPESRRIFEHCRFEDIYYEHCNYFSSGSLHRLLSAQGFVTEQLYTAYEGQYLAAEAALSETSSRKQNTALPDRDLDALRQLVSTFARRNDAKIQDWRQRLDRLARTGPVVLWGSGSKAVAFLHAVDENRTIERVVDINPHRQGHFVPGSAQRIISPTELRENPASSIIIMNPVYRQEIADLMGSMGLKTDLLSL